MLKRAAPHSRGYAQTIAVSVRAYLRFLSATGRCGPELRYAIPPFASWQLSTVPRHLHGDDVQRVISACPAETHPRDRAVVLLLARLGLRAGEVANLKLIDIDWKESRLAISGKSRRVDRLPLTQEIGDAILDYLRRDRPPSKSPYVFLTMIAPLRPMTRGSVKDVVKRALNRSGVESPTRGAHLLRHSAATAMLRNGVTLAGVGAVLRHKSPSTTGIYAKADIDLLCEVAKPWIGRLPC